MAFCTAWIFQPAIVMPFPSASISNVGGAVAATAAAWSPFSFDAIADIVFLYGQKCFNNVLLAEL